MSKAKTVKEVLIAARWILENYGWCQKAYARNANGQSVWEGSSEATCFCLSGALFVVDTRCDLRDNVRNLVMEELNTSMPIFNDAPGRTKQEVLDLLDKVIARTK